MTNKFLAAAGLTGLISLAGCATPERFVLLPQADGSPSAIVVHVRGGEAMLSTPYAAAEAVPDKVSPVQVTEAEVRARYQAVYAADPPRARAAICCTSSLVPIA